MHGVPPSDFPQHEVAELFTLHARLEHTSRSEREALERRYTELDARIRMWPRTEHNDPFFAASQDLSVHLKRVIGYEVLVAFNEFCSPSVDEALDQATKKGADKVVIITTMMTRGGEHSEVDIADAIRRAQTRHPGVPIIYAWPFEVSEVAQFLAAQIARFT